MKLLPLVLITCIDLYQIIITCLPHLCKIKSNISPFYYAPAIDPLIRPSPDLVVSLGSSGCRPGVWDHWVGGV